MPPSHSSSASSDVSSGWRRRSCVIEGWPRTSPRKRSFARGGTRRASTPAAGTATTWVLAITRNLAIDTIRVRRPTAVDPASLPGLDLAAANPSPDEMPGLRDDVDQARAALGDLPE